MPNKYKSYVLSTPKFKGYISYGKSIVEWIILYFHSRFTNRKIYKGYTLYTINKKEITMIQKDITPKIQEQADKDIYFICNGSYEESKYKKIANEVLGEIYG